jgi:hypothetical protein
MTLFYKIKKRWWLLIIGCACIVAFVTVAFTRNKHFIKKEKVFNYTEKNFSVPTENEVSDTLSFLPIVPVRLSVNLNFCGEKVPLTDWDVRERMEREMLVNIYYQSNTIQYLKLSRRYFNEIEKTLKEEGVPDDFKYLALAESGLRNITSPAKAVGFWQFIKETGIRYGLESNEYIDMRYDTKNSTIAACNYLKEAYNRFGNWTMAAASYNMGQAGLQSDANFQQSNNYYDLLLNLETSRYIFRIVALKEICQHPEKYGFHLEDDDLYKPIPYTIVTVDSSISNLVAFAQQYGTNYKMIKLMNPWIQGHSFVNKLNKPYDIKIPYSNK